jgi:fructuronate reductase
VRLSAATAARLPDAVARPAYDRDTQRVGIVHLGLGAFARAHPAWFTDRAMDGGDRDWAITGASLRAPAVQRQVAPQDGLYTVHERGGGTARVRLIGALRDVIVAPEAPGRLRAALTALDVAIVTLTVTEKGYYLQADGTLDVAAVAAAEGTIYHHLADALADRRAGGAGGLTLLSCDNLSGNGAALAGALATWLDRTDPALARWFAAECRCPSTMVDRIVPATRPDDLDAAATTLGVRDEAAVVTEPFAQWVVEDRFAGRRPRWELAGAQLVADAGPYEAAKLRMLNGAHSALAYLGLAAGHTYVHQAIADSAIRAAVDRLMRVEAAGGLDPAPGQDLPAYADALLARFANAALPHALAQIATDGSQKIAPRWLSSLAANAARGRACPATLRALAAWMEHVRGDAGPVDDPRAAELAALWQQAGCDGIVDALFGPHGLFAGPWHPTDADRQQLTAALTE